MKREKRVFHATSSYGVIREVGVGWGGVGCCDIFVVACVVGTGWGLFGFRKEGRRGKIVVALWHTDQRVDGGGSFFNSRDSCLCSVS